MSSRNNPARVAIVMGSKSDWATMQFAAEIFEILNVPHHVEVVSAHRTPDKRHCCKVSDEAAFCLIQRPYISKTLLTRRISPRGSP